MGVGASHSSVDTSNDRGTKGWRETIIFNRTLGELPTVNINPQTIKLEDIGRKARFVPTTVFNNIGHVIDINLLRDCYQLLDGSKAVGIDDV